MKRIVSALFLTCVFLSLSGQEYYALYNGEKELFVNMKNEVEARLVKNVDADGVICMIKAFGEVAVDTGKSYYHVRVTCIAEQYAQLLSFCGVHKSNIPWYSPVLTTMSDSLEVRCTGQVVALLNKGHSKKDVVELQEKFGFQTPWESPYCDGKYVFAINSNDGAQAFSMA